MHCKPPSTPPQSCAKERRALRAFVLKVGLIEAEVGAVGKDRLASGHVSQLAFAS